MKQTIGDKIRKLRYDLSLNQDDFVENLGIKRSYLSMIESNKKKPGRELLIKMSKEYNVSLDWLTADQDHNENSQAHNEDEALLLYAFRNMPEDEAKTHLQLMLQRAEKTLKKK